MGRDGFVNPLTDRAETILGLCVAMGSVGVDQTQDEEDVQQQIEAKRRCCQGFKRLSVVGCSLQKRHE
jgi:hypothetical protein